MSEIDSNTFTGHRAEAEQYLRRIAAIDTAAHGYWDGPPELDGRHDPLIAHILEMRDAWLALRLTTLAADRIREQHADLMGKVTPKPEIAGRMRSGG